MIKSYQSQIHYFTCSVFCTKVLPPHRLLSSPLYSPISHQIQLGIDKWFTRPIIACLHWNNNCFFPFTYIYETSHSSLWHNIDKTHCHSWENPAKPIFQRHDRPAMCTPPTYPPTYNNSKGEVHSLLTGPTVLSR